MGVRVHPGPVLWVFADAAVVVVVVAFVVEAAVGGFVVVAVCFVG